MPVLVGTHVITCEDCGELVNQSDYILHAKKHGKHKKTYGLESFEHNSKYFIKFFLLDDSSNLNNWGVSKEALDRRISTFLGKPFIRRKDFSHTPARDGDELLRNQENDKVGTIIDVGIDESNGKAFGISEVDEETYKIVQSGEARFVSPAIVFNDYDIQKDGDKETITDFIGAHVALVKDPAFGVVKAQIKGTCSGLEEQCLPNLKMVQAIRVGSTKHYFASPCMEKCLSAKKEAGIPINDQAIAICLSECGESRNSSIQFADEFENLNCREKYATIKDGTVKVDWGGEQHKLLHVRDLPHSHVCITADGEKHIRRAQRFKRPPEDWWDKCQRTIKKGNPDYPQELVDQTCGSMWFHQWGLGASVSSGIMDTSTITNIQQTELLTLDTNYKKCVEEGNSPEECFERHRSSIRNKGANDSRMPCECNEKFLNYLKVSQPELADSIWEGYLKSSLEPNKPHNKSRMSNFDVAQDSECVKEHMDKGMSREEAEEKCKASTGGKLQEQYNQAIKEVGDLKNKLIASERKPIVERIVKAKLDLGKIKPEDSTKESERLLKLETEVLNEMASEYDNLVNTKTEINRVVRPRFVQASTDSKDRFADDIMKELGGR